MFKNPKRRAEDAQVAFGVFLLTPERSRMEAEEVLLSVISTAEIASHDNHGITAGGGHTNIRDRNPAVWKELEEEVWGAVIGGRTPAEILQIVAHFAMTHIESSLLSFREIACRIEETQDAA